jgi:hypothetical protein
MILFLMDPLKVTGNTCADGMERAITAIASNRLLFDNAAKDKQRRKQLRRYGDHKKQSSHTTHTITQFTSQLAATKQE